MIKNYKINLFFINLFFLFLCFINYRTILAVNYEFKQDNLFITRENEIVEEKGAYMDTSFSGDNVSVISPEIELDKGIYIVDVEYETNTSFNTSNIKIEEDTYKGVFSDDIRMDASSNKISYHFYVNNDNTKLRVFNHLWGEEDGDYLLVKNIKIATSASTASLYWFKCVCALLIINALFIFIINRKKINIDISNKLVMFGVITAAIVASIPIFTDYFFIGQDCTFHLMRIEGLKDGILSGQLPVRIQPTWFQNNGYAVSVLYGDLFLYFPAILRLIGISVQNSYKTYIFAINFITAIIAYYSFAKISKSKFIGMMASLVYTLSIYRFTDIYFRAAVGEYTAMAFFPLIIWGLYKIYTTETTKDNRIIWFPLAIGYTGVIQSHVLSCEMVAFFL
ncbi:MAG: hypothetical protein ACLRZ9_13110 [Eubacterium sp.]|uniref:Glycosyltransferase RgtA/B/C/D-like domain-containing protein n=1 Tax=Eisenbergiella tayi TaxID=1432052 RepID=A0A1E3AXD7_9FIRM|nr:hypothetical protein [Eisenbergiella tayi]ODM13334.1 hypothetical protein BEH84_01049 [Eisenbergiella tayi]